MTAASGTERTLAFGGSAVWSFARYLFGFALSFGGHASQQVHILWPSFSKATGSPIEPSLAPVTGQTFCAAAVLRARRIAPSAGREAASLSRNIGVSATGVLRVTVANIPGRSLRPELSRSYR